MTDDDDDDTRPITRLPLSDLELRAAEVRRFAAQVLAQREALRIARDIPCIHHARPRGEPCWPGPPEGICSQRTAQALGMHRARLERERREAEKAAALAERARADWAKAHERRRQPPWGNLPRRAG